MLVSAYGFDPGLRHGVLTKVEFKIDRGGPVTLSRFSVIYSWNKKSPRSLGEKSSPKQVFQLALDILRALDHHPKGTIGVDWDPRSVFWRGRKLQAIQLAFFMGYLTGTAATLGYPVVYLPPEEVRKRLGLTARNSKESLWETLSPRIGAEKVTGDENSDLQDSIILAYLIAIGATR